MSEDGFRTLKIIIDNDNYTIVLISEQYDGYLFQEYDNGAATHRIRYTLEFASIQKAVAFIKAENECYDIIEDYNDSDIEYY